MVRSRNVILAACWLSWLVNFSYRIGFPALLPEVKLEFNLGESEAASLITAVTFGYASSVLLSGFLASKIGDRKVVILSLILPALTLLSLLGIGDYPLLFLALFITGFGTGLYLPAGLTLISRLFPPNMRGKITGIHETAAPTGQVFGPLLVGSLLLIGLAWRESLLAFSLMMLSVALIFYVGSFKKEALPAEAEGKLSLRGLSLPKYLLLLSIYICMTSGTGLVTMVPLYLSTAYGFATAAAAFIVGISRLTGILGQLVSGWLSDKFGRHNVLFFIILVNASAMGVLTFLPNVDLLLLSLLVLAIGQNSFFPVFFALIFDLASEDLRRKIFSLIVSPSMFLGWGLTPLIMGWLAELYGYSAALLYPFTFSMKVLNKSKDVRFAILTNIFRL